MKPFFSIVTVSYNQSTYLRQCIESVLSQDFRDFEYIIQDPGSTDDSRQIIASYGKGIDLVLFAPDNGPADGLNQAFSRANGRYYMFINSDDLLNPYALSRIHAWIQRDKMSHAVYSGGSYIINSAGKRLRRAYSDCASLRRMAYGQSILMQPSSAISAPSFHSVGGFNSNNKSNWDGELFIDLALKRYSFANSRQIFSSYRLHSKSITGSGCLHKQHLQYQSRMYTKITGRPYATQSVVLKALYWAERKVLNPCDTFERLVHGPVYRQS